MRNYRAAISAVAALSVAAGLSAAAGATATMQTATVATTTTVDYRVVVRAEQTSGGAAPTATVTVGISARSRGHWLPPATHRLPETYFWKVVTAPHAVCALTVDTSTASPHLTIGLLETPSIGCAPSRSIRLPGS